MGDFTDDEDLEVIMVQVMEEELLDAPICGSDNEVTVQKLLDIHDSGSKTLGEVINIYAAQKNKEKRGPFASKTG